MSNQGAAEFWAEVEMLSTLRHCNLVSLIGYCNHEKEMILVYEYMPNGTLDHHLHKSRSHLSWLQRLNICIGAGRGLHYLHTGTGIASGVIHRDVKSSNILLHESWAAKLSDFGLSKRGPTNQPSTYVSTRVKGTFGYLDPDYFTTGRLTRKSDVYAFGVVLLEVLCRKRAVDKSLDEEQWGLVTWVQDSIKEGNLKHIIDADIRNEICPKCLKEFVKIANRCLHHSPKQRPTMAEVVVSLECILTLQEKFNNSLQTASRTIFGRLVNMIPFAYNRENYVQGDSELSSNSKGNNGIASSPNVKEFSFVPVRVDDNMFPKMKEVPVNSQSTSPNVVKEFSFDDLKEATREFSPTLLLGEGGFGKVFLGWVDPNTLAPSTCDEGLAVAVKRLRHEHRQAIDEWLGEVNFIGEMTHPNIIRLLGYCRYDHEVLIVYEYMSNKSLDRFLFRDAHNVVEPLPWETRLLIMIRVAHGLSYLHSRKIIHRNLKSAKILLDKDFNAKIGGFKLAKYGPEAGETHVSTVVMGTYGYACPEYVTTGQLSMKSDIYSFGALLLESMIGRKAIDVFRTHGLHSFVDWARNLKEIMDPRLEHNYSLQGASECFALVLRCLERKPKDRPSSEEVLLSLEQVYAFKK